MLNTNNTGIPAWDVTLKKWIGDGDLGVRAAF